MNSVKSIAELKASARAHLDGKYPRTIVTYVLYTVICTFVFSIVPSLNVKSLPNVLLFFALSFCALILAYVFKIGLYHYMLNINCDRPANTSDIIYGYARNRKCCLTFSFILQTILFVCMAPMFIYAYTTASHNLNNFVFMLVLGLIGFAAYYYIFLDLSQAPFLVSDFPEKNPREIIKISRWLMKDHKKRFVLLQLSFVPLWILGLLTFGIGLLWIEPYIASTYCSFYLDLSASKSK